MDDTEFCVSIKRWLGVIVTPSTDSKCLDCHIQLTPKASHTSRCLRKGDIITRHNHLSAIFTLMSSNACLAPVREKLGLLGETPGLRPADVFLPELWGGPVAVDFAVTCPLQSHYKSTSAPAEQYALNQKHKKYDAGFEKTDILFVAAVADTFGGWTKEGEDLIKEVARRGAKRLLENCGEYSKNCWARLSVSLQTDIARMMISRLPLPVSNTSWT